MTIHEYAAKGDCKGVEAELAKGVLVDDRDEHDHTPLAYAAKSQHANESMLRLLISSGADVNAPVDSLRSVPLGLAACSGNLGKLRCLLDAGADVNVVRSKGYTILINVMYCLHDSEALVPVVELLVNRGAIIDCQSDYGESPLRVASMQGRFDAVKTLVAHGTDPTPLKWTPLMKAIALGNREDVSTLLVDASDFSSRDSFDRTPWLLAAFVGELEKATLLYAVGVDLDERGRSDGTALMICAAKQNAELLEWLVSVGANIEATDESGNTALMVAARAGATSCVQLLLNAGANASRTNTYDENAIAMASNESIIRLLAQSGGDIGDISTEMKRRLLGLEGGDDLGVLKAEYLAQRHPRFGELNPQVMHLPFWHEMVRTGLTAYQAKAQFGDVDNFEGPVWCFCRFGMSFTELPDGRVLQIGGEHEDYYDPDFCIYNEVVIHERAGEFQILGYPREVFPPTDFHSATHISGSIYILGGLGYHGSRKFGKTPVYRLDCKMWRIEEVMTAGENPGWIYKHGASSATPGFIVLCGGKVCKETDGAEQHDENTDRFSLNLSTMRWTRL